MSIEPISEHYAIAFHVYTHEYEAMIDFEWSILSSEEQENVLSRGGLRKDDFARVFFAFIEVDAFDKWIG